MNNNENQWSHTSNNSSNNNDTYNNTGVLQTHWIMQQNQLAVVDNSRRRKHMRLYLTSSVRRVVPPKERCQLLARRVDKDEEHRGKLEGRVHELEVTYVVSVSCLQRGFLCRGSGDCNTYALDLAATLQIITYQAPIVIIAQRWQCRRAWWRRAIIRIMCIYIYIYTHVYIDTYIYIYICTHTYTYTYIHIYICTYLCI